MRLLKIPSSNATLGTAVESDSSSKKPYAPRKGFVAPDLTGWMQKWINSIPEVYPRILARCHSKVYHLEHTPEWESAVKHQLGTGDNSPAVSYVRNMIASIENHLQYNGHGDSITFKQYLQQEAQRMLLEQRFKGHEGACAHDSLYNTLMIGFKKAIFLLRDGENPRYLTGFMAEEENDTCREYNPDKELNKPLNRRIFGRGIYHDGLQPDPPIITEPGSGWHNLLQDIVDSNRPLGIVSGYGDDDEFTTGSPRAVLLVQGHSNNLDTRVLREIKQHAMYVAQKVMPHSPDYLPIPKP